MNQKSKLTQNNSKPMISLRGISKAFPLVQANDNIDLDIYPHEIHALLGENGAGKSTLMKILYGFYRADSGLIFHNGEKITITSPKDAMDIHIGMVFQDLKIIPAFSVAENITLFLRDLPFLINADEIRRQIREISIRYGLDVNPDALASQLSIGELQKVEIIKLLMSDAKLLILDEPTRVLAPHEIDALFEILEKLCSDGFAVVLITHKLKEVLDCADRISVLRKGKLIDTLLRNEANEENLIHLTFDQLLTEINKDKKTNEKKSSDSLPVLSLAKISTAAEGMKIGLREISFEVLPGEIMGVAGVSGNGQKELADVILGIEKSSSGKKQLFGSDITNSSVREMRNNNLSFIPEDPLYMAVNPFMTVLENMVITSTREFESKNGLTMNWQKAEQFTREALHRYDCTFSLNAMTRTLSGGNLQRMIVARELSSDPRLVVASYLTRGLDARSTIAARQALLEVRNQGAAVLLISEDLDELFQLSDRLIVLAGGKIAGQFKPEETSPYEIGHLMTGMEVKNA